MDTVGEGEGGMNGQSSTHTHTLPCKTDSQREVAVQQGAGPSARDNLEGRMGVERWEGDSRGKGHAHTYG